MAVIFEWDGEKARRNLEKHGVSFEEALTVFADPLARILDDEDHSSAELREIIIGLSARARLLIVSFTERREDRIRIVSARKATAAERREHEEGKAR